MEKHTFMDSVIMLLGPVDMTMFTYLSCLTSWLALPRISTERLDKALLAFSTCDSWLHAAFSRFLPTLLGNPRVRWSVFAFSRSLLQPLISSHQRDARLLRFLFFVKVYWFFVVILLSTNEHTRCQFCGGDGHLLWKVGGNT